MKNRDPGKVGRWDGPPVEGWAEFEKVAILRAREKNPRFPDAEDVGLKAMVLHLPRFLHMGADFHLLESRGCKKWI